MTHKNKLNWKATTLSGVFGYESLKELATEEPELVKAVVTLSALSRTKDNKTVGVLCSVLEVITGIEIVSTANLMQYLMKLPEEDFETIASTLIQALAPELIDELSLSKE